MMQNYSRSNIYKLVSGQTEDIYIGATINALRTRKSQHKSRYKRWINGKGKYITSCEIMKYDDCQIILIEEYSCQNRDQLNSRERYWIEKLVCVNKCIPTRTHVEWYEKNKKRLLKYQKEYNEKNKEKVLKYQKEYNEKNKEKVREHQKEYNKKNKEKIRERRKNSKYKCKCGSIICRSSLSQHRISIKHQKFYNLYYLKKLPFY